MTSHLLSLPPPAPPSQRPSSSTATIPLPSSYLDKTATSLSVSVAGEPPTYSPSADVPAYSVAPAPSERTLAVTARSRRRTYTGVFVRKNSLITVALRGQDEYASSPSYGRGGTISGDVGLSCTQGVQAVFVKLEGRVHLASPEGASSETPFFCASYDLWKWSKDDADGHEQCPSIVPFEILLPETFMDKGGRRALPPTHDIVYPNASDIRAKCYYLLRFVVRRKGTKLPIWKLAKKLEVPFVYQPRTRPPQPIISSPFPFLSTVKSSPEEWSQVTTTINPKVNADIEPIDCHLFIPVVQTFALTDAIPFYLQLIAPSKSLQAFLYPTIPTHMKLKRSKSIATETTAPPTVRVYLLRQIVMAVRGQLSMRQFSIGEGNLRCLPPGASLPSMLRSEPLGDGMSTLDYEGEVQPNPDITVGQFGMSRLQIRDFITTYLAPPNQFTSPLLVHQHSHPIRLVTDPFSDGGDRDGHTL